MTHLFQPFPLRSLAIRNRIGVSPMCMYSAQDGLATDWHLVHYGGLAQGGAGLVMLEATAVRPEGRITARDLGLWNDAQIEPLARLSRFIREQGAVPAVQLAHAGRKAGTFPPSTGRSGSVALEDGGWIPVAPSPLPFEGLATPMELDEAGIQEVIQAFRDAAGRALAAGIQLLELHAAHGYLLHQFLSPISNRRTDRWGGDFVGRTRLVREVVQIVRIVWPEYLPLAVRLSCTEYLEGGWDVDQSVELSRQLKALGVDLIDCSSGGGSPTAPPNVGAGFQVSFAERIHREAGMATAAVGLITSPEQAETIVASGQADLVFLGRELLRDPRWPLRAAEGLRAQGPWPEAYLRARR